MGRDGHGWLVRIRWAASGCALALLALAYALDPTGLPWGPLLGVVSVALLGNAALVAAGALGRGPELVGPTLLLDVATLTLGLALAGGPANPFSIFFLVLVTLAAVSTGPRWTGAVVALAIAGYGALFPLHLPLPASLGGGHDQAQGFDAHLQGMWLAFAIAATAIGLFVTRIRRALDAERERSARASRLAATTTLAAGAAHELATPLATIRVAAGELERALVGRDELAPLLDDVRLVRAEVERSRAVLDRLALDSGALAGEACEAVLAGELIDAALESAGPGRARIDVRADRGLAIKVPLRGLANALASLLRNALEAGDGAVELALARRDRALELVVEDRGRGMSAEVLARLGEPFFTTRPPGSGLGLGVFLARSLAEQLGGALDVDSHAGRGTRVRISIPEAIA